MSDKKKPNPQFNEEAETEGATTVLVDLHNGPLSSPKKLKTKVAILQVLEGQDKGRIIPLDLKSPIVVGRSAECAVTFDDPSCSRKHAQFEKISADQFLLNDLKSTNGTKVNDVAVVVPVELKHGDKIQFGHTVKTVYSIVDEDDANLQLSMYNRATSDQLTGAANRFKFQEALERELYHRERSTAGLGLVMFDVDHFKKVNDTYGHNGGDAVLKAIGEKILAMARKEDLFARVGGEEFAILTRNHTKEELMQFGERLRITLSQLKITHETHTIQFTVSVGMTFVSGPLKIKTEALVKVADDALYEAKNSGRNNCKMKLPA